jgi:hypothetical protein
VRLSTVFRGFVPDKAATGGPPSPEKTAMNKLVVLSLTAALAVASFAAAAVDSRHVPGEKVDSGLGDLPHYSQWADPTGKTPMQPRAAVAPKQAAAVVRSGDAKAAPVQVSQSR